MTTETAPYSNPENWLAREAAGDQLLQELLESKERFMSSLTQDELASPGIRMRIQEINQTIASRQERLGIDPMIGPDMAYHAQDTNQ